MVGLGLAAKQCRTAMIIPAWHYRSCGTLMLESRSC